MNSSASRSSSVIGMPGRRLSPISPSVSATIWPARAIPSISSRDLRMIISTSFNCRYALERFLDLGEDFVDRLLCVNSDEISRRAVVLDERLGLLVVELEPLRDRLAGVVGTPLLGGSLQ